MKLKAKARKDLPASDFSGPGRTFPTPDVEHARLAIGAATRSKDAGHISAAEAKKIQAKARHKLGLINGARAGGNAGGNNDDGSDDGD